MSFHIGQLVCCIDDGPHPEWHLPGVKYSGNLHGLTRNTVYTIRESGYLDSDEPDRLTVRLVEIKRDHDWPSGLEASYDASRFRHITEQRLEIFRSLLVPTRKEKVEA